MCGCTLVCTIYTRIIVHARLLFLLEIPSLHDLIRVCTIVVFHLLTFPHPVYLLFALYPVFIVLFGILLDFIVKNMAKSRPHGSIYDNRVRGILPGIPLCTPFLLGMSMCTRPIHDYSGLHDGCILVIPQAARLLWPVHY